MKNFIQNIVRLVLAIGTSAALQAGVKINIQLGSGCPQPPLFPPFYAGAPIVILPSYPLYYYGYGVTPYPWGLPVYASGTSSAAVNHWVPMGQSPSASEFEILRQFEADHPSAIQRSATPPDSPAPEKIPPGASAAPREDPLQWFREMAESYRREADRGVADAQFNLAGMYEAGVGVPRDNMEAYRWFSLSGATEQRDRVAQQMTPEQIAEAQRRVATFVPSQPRLPPTP